MNVFHLYYWLILGFMPVLTSGGSIVADIMVTIISQVAFYLVLATRWKLYLSVATVRLILIYVQMYFMDIYVYPSISAIQAVIDASFAVAPMLLADSLMAISFLIEKKLHQKIPPQLGGRAVVVLTPTVIAFVVTYFIVL